MKNQKVLLVKFKDENGVHYNLPGGGVEQGESTSEAAMREAREEAGVEAEVNNLAFIYEYTPHQNEELYGLTPTLSLFFDCSIIGSSKPSMPDAPDVNQTGVEWFHLTELDSILLYPKIQKQIKEYALGHYEMDLIEECKLMKD
jgi:8-oxo-dGTP diphosphatase